MHASCHGRRAGCTPLASGPLRGSTALFSAPFCHNTELFPSCTTAPPNNFNQIPASLADSSCCLSQATPVPDLNLNPKSTVLITTLPFFCYNENIKYKKTRCHLVRVRSHLLRTETSCTRMNYPPSLLQPFETAVTYNKLCTAQPASVIERISEVKIVSS